MEEKEFQLIEVNKSREFLFSKGKCEHLEYYVNETEFISALDEFNKIKSGRNFAIKQRGINKNNFM